MNLARPLASALARSLARKTGGEFTPLDLDPVFAVGGRYAWLNQAGTMAGYLDTVATFKNYGTHPNDGVQGTANSQPVCLAHSGRNYLHLPGVIGNYATIPTGDEFDLSGDVTFEFDVQLNDYSSPSFQTLAVKRNSFNSQHSFLVGIVNGEIYLDMSNTGGDTTFVFRPFSAIDKQRTWFRVQRTMATGLVRFFVSTDGVTYTQQGSDATLHAGLAFYDSPVVLRIGADDVGNGGCPYGAMNRVRFWSSLDTATEPFLDCDFSIFEDRSTYQYEIATGQSVTIVDVGGNPAVIVGRPLLRFDGVDDKFTVPGLALDGPMTFIYVATWSTKDSVAWADPGDGGRYATSAINDAVTVTDAPPAGIGSYRKNGSALGSIASRGDLYTELANQRVLLIDQFTFSSGGTDSGFSAYVGLEFRGDLEAIYIYPRIVPPDELAKLETYLMNRYGI